MPSTVLTALRRLSILFNVIFKEFLLDTIFIKHFYLLLCFCFLIAPPLFFDSSNSIFDMELLFCLFKNPFALWWRFALLRHLTRPSKHSITLTRVMGSDTDKVPPKGLWYPFKNRECSVQFNFKYIVNHFLVWVQST